MTLLVLASFRRSFLLVVAAVFALSLLLSPSATAQIALSHTEDASAVPGGMLRLRVTTAWTRFDHRYGPAGLLALGDELSADPLGATQLPRLAPIEAAIQALAADPRMRLSLGRLLTRGDTRIVTTPIALEYGVSRRLSIGVIVPVVQTRRTVSLDVNSRTGTPANVGFVPLSQRAAAADSNRGAAASYVLAATNLSDLLNRCRGTPTGAGCAAVSADASGAAATSGLALRFAEAIRGLGTDTGSARIAPRAMGLFAVEIELQRNELNRLLQRYLGESAAQVSQIYFAPTDFSYVDLQGRDGTQGLLQSQLGGGIDSIHTTERIGVGDISIGAQYLVYDHFERRAPAITALRSRLAIGGALRFATSRADTATNLVDIGTGNGAGVELHSAFDVIRGNVGATVAARFAKSFGRTVTAPLLGDPDAGFPLPSFGTRRRTAGDVIGLDLTPRYLLSEMLALDGHYGVERTGGVTYDVSDLGDQPSFCAIVSCATPPSSSHTAQRLGIGLRYSTVDSYARGTVPYPFEVSFTHLSTFTGSAGADKLWRDQIQLRLFYRLFGH